MERGETRATSAGWGRGGELLVELVKDGKVVHGKDGWLFLADDGNDVMGQHSGKLRLSREQLERWRSLLDARARQLSELAVPYFFFVAPDTHAVYPEQLPDGFVPARERPIHQLISALDGSPVEPIYPLAEMKEAKQQGHVCSPVDTHWSGLGALIAYRRLMDAVETVVPVRRVAADDVIFEPADVPSDLAYKLGIPSVVQTIARVLPMARLVHDNSIPNIGSIVTTECLPAPDVTCVLFGDSYGQYLLRFLAESFRRFVFAHTSAVDYELVARERPDVVITEMAERFLLRVPDDDTARPVEEIASEKRRAKLLRPSLTNWNWDPPADQKRPTVLAVDAVERMRARLLTDDHRRDAALVCLLAYAGMRPAEALTIRWGDVDGDRLRIRSRSADGGAEERVVPLFGPLLDDLAALGRHTHPPEQIVLPNDGGWTRAQWLGWRDEVYRPLARAEGLESPEPYELRHTFIALLLGEGASWRRISRLLGTTIEEAFRAYRSWADDLSEVGQTPADERIRRARVALATEAGPR